MGRAPCCDKANVKKGPWSPEEDAKLKEFIEKFGTGGNWIALPQKAGLKRCGKSCRLRWLNYLRPNIRHGEFSDDEDRIICSLYASIGSRWSVIAAQLPGRTDNDIKNYWNTKLKKKLLTMFPSLQEKQTLFPSMSFQPPPPPPLSLPQYEQNYISSQLFLNTTTPSSSFYTTPFSPNFMMNPDNTTTCNSLLVHEDHVINNNVIDLSSPQSPHVNSLMTNNNNNIGVNNSYNHHHHHHHLGFQDDVHHSSSSSSMCNNNNSPMQEHYHDHTSSSAMKEGMVMFGSASCCYNKDVHQDQKMIKQENDHDHHALAGDQTHHQHIPAGFMTDDHKQNEYMIIKNTLHNDLGEVKQLNFSSYLFNDGDETKTTMTHYQKGMCSYYY